MENVWTFYSSTVRESVSKVNIFNPRNTVNFVSIEPHQATEVPVLCASTATRAGLSKKSNFLIYSTGGLGIDGPISFFASFTDKQKQLVLGTTGPDGIEL